MGTPRFLLLDHLKEEDVPHFFQGQPSAALTFPPNYGRILMYTGWCFGAQARSIYEGAMCHGTNQDSGNPGYVRERQERRLRRVPDFLPVRLQDQLRRGQPEM